MTTELDAEKARALAVLHANSDAIRRQEQFELARLAFSTMTARSPLFDRASLWLLGAAGAAAALSVSQIAELTAALGKPGARWCIAALAASLTCGFISRGFSLIVQFQSEMAAELWPAMAAVRERFASSYAGLDELAERLSVPAPARADWAVLRQEMMQAAPFFLRYFVARGADKGYLDPLSSFRAACRRCHWQGLFFALQFLCFVAFVWIAAAAI